MNDRPATPEVADDLPRGWTSGPAHFGDSAAEDRAARTDAALFDLTGRTHLVLTGKDRARFLHGFCTNDIKKLQSGEGCEAFVTSIKGRIVEHILAFVTDDAIHIDSTAAREAPLFTHLDKYLIREDVEIARRTDATGALFVTGPQAEARLASAGIDASELAAYAHRVAQIHVADAASVRSDAGCVGHAVLARIARVDLLNALGFVLFAERTALPALRAVLTDTGIVPAGSAAFEPLRIEAGLPLYGVDITEDNLAQEAMRTAKAISFTKGCYLGQEPIARLDALGHVNRQLAGLRLATGPVPPLGTTVTTTDGKEIGSITSAALAPGSIQPVALGMLRSQVCRPDAALLVQSPDGPVGATWFGW